MDDKILGIVEEDLIVRLVRFWLASLWRGPIDVCCGLLFLFIDFSVASVGSIFQPYCHHSAAWVRA